MADFSLRNGLMSANQSVLDTDNGMEKHIERTMERHEESTGCTHCDKLRAQFGKLGPALGMNGFSRPAVVEESSWKPPASEDEHRFEANGRDITEKDETDFQPIRENGETYMLSATVKGAEVKQHGSKSPVLRRNNIPQKYFGQFASLSLYSGTEMAEEIGTLIKRLQQCEMSDEEIEKYLKQREIDCQRGQTSDVYITFEGEKCKIGLKIYTRASRSLQGLRHFIQGTEDCQIARDLGIKENDMLLMIDSECVTENAHKQVVNCLSKAIKEGEEIALVVFRDLPGINKNMYLTVRGNVAIFISRGEEPIEVTVVDPLMQEIDNRVIGLKKEFVMPPIFVWQHELMGISGQYSLSVSMSNELHMDETFANDQRAHWVIHQYAADIVTFEDGRRKRGEEGAAHPHSIWLIRNKDTGEFIAVSESSKVVYLSKKGLLPDHDDVMAIDERMLVAHMPYANIYLFESLGITNHFLCIDETDSHKVDVSDNTNDSEMNRFAFQINDVNNIIGSRGRMETITKMNLPEHFHFEGAADRKPISCLSHLTEERSGGPNFEPYKGYNVAVNYGAAVHIELDLESDQAYNVAVQNGDAVNLELDQGFVVVENGSAVNLGCRRNGSFGCDADGEDKPTGDVRARWPPVLNGSKKEDLPVLRRQGMHRFVPPAESPAEKEGVAISGHVRGAMTKFETGSSRESCAVQRGHVEVLSKTFKV